MHGVEVKREHNCAAIVTSLCFAAIAPEWYRRIVREVMGEVVSCIVAMIGVEPSKAAQEPETIPYNPIQPHREGRSAAASHSRFT